MKKIFDQSVTATPLPISMAALAESLIDPNNASRAISVDDLHASTKILLQQQDAQQENQREISVDQPRTSVFDDGTSYLQRLASTDSRLSTLTGQDLIMAPSTLQGVIMLHGHFKWLNRFVILENGILYFYAKSPTNTPSNDTTLNSANTANTISVTKSSQACLKEIPLYLYTVATNEELELVLLGRSSKTANLFLKCVDDEQITHWAKLIEQHIYYSILMKREENRVTRNNNSANLFTSPTSTIPSNERDRPVRSIPHHNSVMRSTSGDDSSVYSAAFRDSNMTPDVLPDTSDIRFSEFESRQSSLNSPSNQNNLSQNQNFIPFSAAHGASGSNSAVYQEYSSPSCNAKNDVSNTPNARNLSNVSNSTAMSSSAANPKSLDKNHAIKNPLHEKLIDNSFEIGNTNLRILKGSVLVQKQSCSLPCLSCYTAIPKYLSLDQTSLKLYRQIITDGPHDDKVEIEIMINQCDVSLCHLDSTKFRITVHSKQSLLGIIPYPGESFIIQPMPSSDSHNSVKDWIEGILGNIKYYA